MCRRCATDHQLVYYLCVPDELLRGQVRVPSDHLGRLPRRHLLQHIHFLFDFVYISPMTTSSDKPEGAQAISEQQKNIAKALVESAGQSAAIPHYYFNGMIVAQGTSDVTLILQLNNQPVAALNCSFTIAKTLSQALDKGIKQLETIAGTKIMTVDDITRFHAKTKS